MANILLVEDDLDLIAAYTIVLEAAHHNVRKAHNGDEALAAVKNYEPDLIILDLLMPIKSGKEFLKSYKRNTAHQKVKIVVFTNMQDAGEAEEVYELGADKYFVKSWTGPTGLLKIVDEVTGVISPTS
jgi:DNA-binding response OmpR family regulator